MVPENGYSSNYSQSAQAAAAGTPAGNVTCNINVQTPHAGSGPNSTIVPKAKSSGTCSYQHVGPGAPPPTLRYELDMILLETQNGGNGLPTNLWTETKVRNGLVGTWGSSGTQVFGQCPGATRIYSHSNIMWVIPPAGWTYVTQNPFQVGNPKVAVISC